MSAGRPTLLVIQHVPWETPHRILDVCDGLGVRTVEPLVGEPLPDHDEVSGVLAMGELLARALGAEVRAGEAPEIGFAPVEIHDPADPIVGPLAPEATVLHWHGDVFDLPDGAVSLASSARTKHQAFRHGNAGGPLFHAEPDVDLVDKWLAEPTMHSEAMAALGADAPAMLRRQAREVEPDLIAGSAKGFQAFTALLTLD